MAVELEFNEVAEEFGPNVGKFEHWRGAFSEGLCDGMLCSVMWVHESIWSAVHTVQAEEIQGTDRAYQPCKSGSESTKGVGRFYRYLENERLFGSMATYVRRDRGCVITVTYVMKWC